MISDNFVVGDNVYLNELRNFFFEVLGMMSVTHYGAIGDGRTDNYAPLQVAIDDANRRHLTYIYVPWGRYRFRGELQHMETITFIGNPQARIYNDKTGVEIPVVQFGVEWIAGTTTLNDSITLIDGEALSLGTGSYYTGPYNVSYDGGILIPSGTQFYYDADTQTLSWAAGTAAYANDSWTITQKLGETIHYLTEDLLLVDGEEPSLEEGIYYTGAYSVNSSTKTWIGPYEAFYYNVSDKTFVTPMYNFYLTIDEERWEVANNEYIAETLVDNKYKFPTSKAVYDYITASYYTKAEVDALIGGISPTPPTPTPGGDGVAFTESLAPTSWTTDVEGFRYTATNAYGTWTCLTDEPYRDGQTLDSYSVKRLFDSSDENQWRSKRYSSSDYNTYATLLFPVLIKPSQIYLRFAAALSGGRCHIQLLKQNGDWETIYTNTSGNSFNVSLPLSKNEFYKGIRFYGRINSSGSNDYISGYALRIDQGYWKVMS